MEFIHPNEGVPFLLPRRASRAMAGVLFFLASGIVYVTVEASRDLSPLPWGEIGFSACLAGFFLSFSHLLIRRKGGIQKTANSLWVGGVERGIPLPTGKELRLVLHKRRFGNSPDASEVWEVEARTNSGVIVLLGESGDEESARNLLELLTQDSPDIQKEELENFSPAREQPPVAEHSQTGGSALVLPLLLGSATFIWAGVGFWVAASGALSFALGPPFALLGLAVLVTRGAMRAARLSWKTRGDELHWTLSVGGLPIASRTLSAVGGQYARLRPGGARGWSIEWVGPEGTWALVGSLTASDVARFNIPLERIFSEMNQA